MSADDEMPEALRSLVPQVGSWWIWEPMTAYARQRVQVTAVEWNGEEVWIESTGITVTGEDGRWWNDFSRWIEATVFDAEPDPALPPPDAKEQR